MLQELRNSGYGVRVHHKRRWRDMDGEVKFVTRHKILSNDGNFEYVYQTGGETIVELVSPDGKSSSIGTAKCSEKDPFNRKLGLKIALGRALEQLK